MKINQTEMDLNNSVTKICYTIVNLALIICYYIEVIKGDRTIGYFITLSLLAMLPLIAVYVVHARDKETKLVKYIVPGGFGIFYLFIVFTTFSPVAYVYAFLMAAVLLVFNDIRVTGFFSGLLALGNIIHVIYLGVSGQIAKSDMANIEIRVASAILFSLFIVFSSLVLNRNNRRKLEEIEAERARTAAIMDNLLRASQKLTTDIETVTGMMSMLETSSAKTMSSMEEVAQGTSDTADSIQHQLERTENIQETVVSVNEVSNKMEEHLDDTRNELKNAQKNIDELIERVNISNKENARVSQELAELCEYTGKMQSIINMIEEITSQTSLLSLNASIEAARAGEAGRGFAVVATEISGLATQTQNATESIAELINNISAELEQVVEVVEGMIGNIDIQSGTAHNVADSFDVINVSANEVFREAKELKRLVGILESDNQAIVSGIETISATTEEVTAHSSETYESSAENSMITTEVGGIIQELHKLAQNLVANN